MSGGKTWDQLTEKEKNDLTPTEVADLQTPGHTKDTGPGLYDRFRKVVDEHPMLSAAGLGMLYGPAGISMAQGLKPTTGPMLKPDAPFERNPPPPGENATGYHPLGREPQDRAAAFRAAVAGPQTQMAPGMGPGGGAQVSQGSGWGTDKRIQAAQQAEMDAMKTGQDAREAEGNAHLDVMRQQAQQSGQTADFMRAGADAVAKVQQEERERQHRSLEAYQQANDEMAARGIDPGRHMRNRDGLFWMNMMVGSVASGLLSAMNGQNGNPFMDAVRETVRDDINSQEKGLENGWKRVKGMETSYELARQSGADRVSATIQQYDTHLAALQKDFEGRLTSAKLPEEKARIQQALASITQERAHWQAENEKYWQHTYQTRAQAAAAQAIAAQERLFNHSLAMRKMANEESRTEAQNTKDMAEAGAAMGVGPDGRPLPGGGMTKEQRGAMAKEQAEADRSLHGNLMTIDQMRKDLPKFTDINRFTSIPAWAGVDSSKQHMADFQAQRNRVELMVSAMRKEATDAADSKRLQNIEREASAVVPQESDGPELAAYRLDLLEKLVRGVAINKGVENHHAPGEASLSDIRSYRGQ